MMFISKAIQLKRSIPVRFRKALKRLQPTKTTDVRPKLKRLYLNKAIVRQSIANTFHNFARETSIHGLKHLFVHFNHEEVRGRIGRWIRLGSKSIWISSVTSCFVLCVSLMTISYLNFFATLTTTTIESINYPISEVAFPAVTFCSINKVYEPNTKLLLDVAKKEGMDNRTYLKYLKSLSKLTTFDLEQDKEVLDVEQVVLKQGLTVQRIMKEVAQSCGKMMMYCEIRGDIEKCGNLFKKIRSNQGYCCSFNYFGLRDHLLLDSTGAHNTHLTVEGAGKYVGITVHINSSLDSYLSSSHPFYGTFIIIHEATNYPEFSKSVDLVQPGQEVRLAIIPTVIVSTEDVRNMPLDQRYCLFPEEKEIAISEDYSFSNCLSECRAKVIIKACGCIPFYYPTFNEIANSTVCQLKDTPCLNKNRKRFQSIQVTSETFLRTDQNKSLNGLECDCLPTCSSVKFDVNRFTGNITGHPTLGNHSIVHVYFNALTCIKYRRDIFMTWDTLLATFGGLFSLCLGGSVLSIIEIIYFWTYIFFMQLHKQVAKLRFKAITRLIMVQAPPDTRRKV